MHRSKNFKVLVPVEGKEGLLGLVQEQTIAGCFAVNLLKAAFKLQ